MKNNLRLKDILLPYKETNYRCFESVSVGKYGIRKRKEIYKKKLSKDESKNKVIFKDTLTIGMGSTQIDFGVLWQNGNYSVSPAYHTYKINTQLILSQYLDFFLKYKIKLYSDKYMIHGARQGKKVNMAGLLSEEISLPSKETQLVIVNNLNEINTMIENRLSILNLLEELIESKFKTMFLEKRYGYKPIRYSVQKNILSAKKKYKPEDIIQYIDISCIDNEKNSITGSTTYKLKEAPSRAQQCLIKNDILVSTVRPNLKNVAIFDKSNEGYVASSGFCILRPKSCNHVYLKYIVLMDEFTRAMVKVTNGANYPAVSDDDILDFEMIDAPINEQNIFAKFVENIEELKTNLLTSENTLREFLTKKMSDYFGKDEYA